MLYGKRRAEMTKAAEAVIRDWNSRLGGTISLRIDLTAHAASEDFERFGTMLTQNAPAVVLEKRASSDSIDDVVFDEDLGASFIGINARCNGDMIRIIRIFVIGCNGKQRFRVGTNTITQLMGDFRQQALGFTFKQ